MLKEPVVSFRDRKPDIMEVESPYRMNIPLLLLTFVLICYGMVMLFSASMSRGYAMEQNPLYYVINQAQWTIVGIGIVMVLIFIPIRVFDHWPFFVAAFILAVALAILTWKFGAVYGGSRRWLEFGGRTFQSSEFIKVAIVFCIAGYRSLIVRVRKAGGLKCKNPGYQNFFDGFIDLALPFLAILICLSFVVMQPHMSCFIIVMAISAVCFIVSGIKLRSWFFGGLIILLVLAIALSAFLIFAKEADRKKLTDNFSHVGTRLNIFATIRSEDDPQEDDSETEADENEVYQNRQSIIAIGSGGVSGVGFGNSRQKFMYLPEAHNDFVFAIACEELGFVGGLSIIILFWAFLCGGLSIAWKAKGDFPRILSVGYTSLIIIQAFLNIGVAMGVVPPTGITLPFFSAGGSANLFFLVAVGLLLSVSRSGVSRKKQPIGE
ncbi:MAG: FtsW/RodA/SpoVE family cell cycle protein [Oscillospiraceae bacterium]|nr:FtsW/RodA/SpoVE family cell cycle protein [Clostridiales bacterium]MDD4094786.1 FtsW/RodA/SpoVE family cell cycle protein [Oscillospiraceae bacterium]